MLLDDELAMEIAEFEARPAPPKPESGKLDAKTKGPPVKPTEDEIKASKKKRKAVEIEFLDKHSKDLLRRTSKSFSIILTMHVIAFAVGILLIGTSVYLFIDTQLDEDTPTVEPDSNPDETSNTIQTLSAEIIPVQNDDNQNNDNETDSNDDNETDQNVIAAILASLGVTDIVVLMYRPAREIQKSRVTATKISAVYNTWVNVQNNLGKTYSKVEKSLDQTNPQTTTIVTELLKINSARVTSTTQLLNAINSGDAEDDSTNSNKPQDQPTTPAAQPTTPAAQPGSEK